MSDGKKLHEFSRVARRPKRKIFSQHDSSLVMGGYPEHGDLLMAGSKFDK
jgi:hypothetical protein